MMMRRKKKKHYVRKMTMRTKSNETNCSISFFASWKRRNKNSKLQHSFPSSNMCLVRSLLNAHARFSSFKIKRNKKHPTKYSTNGVHYLYSTMNTLTEQCVPMCTQYIYNVRTNRSRRGLYMYIPCYLSLQKV